MSRPTSEEIRAFAARMEQNDFFELVAHHMLFVEQAIATDALATELDADDTYNRSLAQELFHDAEYLANCCEATLSGMGFEEAVIEQLKLLAPSYVRPR